ncbi:hypothetical protein UY3_06058 [Chelonia mydas]|uniref:Uncharacterized protein n=1 Tax=Chelonia mydas TaxID=8469 RepID=M7BM35_CHEMY|nr:hypothetical protein UY3_06058 [Chelonia mydas]
MAPLWLLRSPVAPSDGPMGAAGAVPANWAACRAAWPLLHVEAGDGTCCGFWEMLEVCNRMTREIEVFSDWFLNVIILDI